MAGQRLAASLCSQRTISDGDSDFACFMSNVRHKTHVHVNQKTQKKKTYKPAFFSANLDFATETSYFPAQN
jgi:hypothetical protein